MLIRHRLAFIATCIVSAISFATVAAPLALLDAIAIGLRWLAAPLLGDAADRSPRLDLDRQLHERPSGNPLESALVNSLRHEAGMRPLRC